VTEEVKGTQCTAKSKRSGERCRRVVLGGGVCRVHGGAAPQVERGRLQRLTEQQAMARARASLPASVPVTPEDALQQELQRTHARIHGLELMIASGDPVGGMTLAMMGDALTSERGQLHRVAADSIRLGVTARIESALDTQAAEVVRFVEHFCRELGLSPVDPMVVEAARNAAQKTDRMPGFTDAEHAAARRRLGR